MQLCILCQSNNTALYYQDRNRRYCNCNSCGCVFIPHEALPGAKEEKERYLSHQNDVEDSGFQKFVSPMVNAIKAKHTTKEKGLDFGAAQGLWLVNYWKILIIKWCFMTHFFIPVKTP